MKTVKITAVKQVVHTDLINAYENPIEHACDIKIGDTLCIIESAVSTDAKETAYNKIKRLILDGADRCEQPHRAA